MSDFILVGRLYFISLSSKIIICEFTTVSMQFEAEQINTICDGIGRDGFVVLENAFSHGFLQQLLQQFKHQQPNDFNLAGIGRDNSSQTNHEIRNDQIMWLDEGMTGCQDYFNWTELLRLALNQQFYLGLFEYECMFAHYPTGAFYKKHVDAFVHQEQPRANRKISTILYLNPQWGEADGGELLLYEQDQAEPFKIILPQLGTLVVFLSEEFPHEVLPAKKSRKSLTGWFRVIE